MLEYLHWTLNTNLLVSVLRKRVSIYWKTFISLNILLEKKNIKASPISATGWGVQTPLAVHGCENVKDPVIIFGATAS